MDILVIKRGALGDVVRTSYFARALKCKHGRALNLVWLTSSEAEPLLRFNPYIDKIATSFEACAGYIYDRVYSLDDEVDTLQGIAGLRTKALTGAYLDSNGVPAYTDDAKAWFDMGLLSRFGKERADELKKYNQKGHAEIFCEIFGVDSVIPYFHNDPDEERMAHTIINKNFFTVAINPFAGKRWPSKELPEKELRKLVFSLFACRAPDSRPIRIILLGAGEDRLRNEAIANEVQSERLCVVNTDASVLRLAAVIKQADLLISSDSLALHLGIAQYIPFIAFFAPTSAAEIDSFGFGIKVISTSSDYCSYKRKADNSTLTSERLIEAYHILIRDWSIFKNRTHSLAVESRSWQRKLDNRLMHLLS